VSCSDLEWLIADRCVICKNTELKLLVVVLRFWLFGSCCVFNFWLCTVVLSLDLWRVEFG
jgi:hypothetical protein